MRELSLNVMDVAQNSVTANASLITITVNESDKDDYLDIFIEDNYIRIVALLEQEGFKASASD